MTDRLGSLREWAEEMDIPYGTVKDWAYRRLKRKGVLLRSPFSLKAARRIAIEGQKISASARGNSEKAGLQNYQKCSEFLQRTEEDYGNKAA